MCVFGWAKVALKKKREIKKSKWVGGGVNVVVLVIPAVVCVFFFLHVYSFACCLWFLCACVFKKINKRSSRLSDRQIMLVL